MRASRISLSTLLFKLLLHPYTRVLAVGAAVLALWWWLAGGDYPWWIWLPACFLGAVFALWLSLMVAYAYQKCTYPLRAREYKRRRQQARSEREGP